MPDIKINIDREEAIRYMGYRAAPEKNQLEMIDRCKAELEKTVKPAWVYRVFDIEFFGGAVAVKGTGLRLKGKDIAAHLAGCEKCVLLCATASAMADELVRRMEAQDIALGFMTDCLASAAVEAVCNRLEEELSRQLSGCSLTWRFSPGYGDFPLEVQPQIISALNAEKRAGVTCTKSLMLVPRKSVTAVIGISKKPIDRVRRGCAACAMNERCEYRKRGTHCGV